MDQSTIISRIRAKTGVTSSQISDDDLGTIIQIALDEYNYYKPDITLTTATTCITTTAEQPNYSKPTDALWIIDVFWSPGIDDTVDTLYEDVLLTTIDADHPVDLLIEYRQLAQLRQYFAGRWKIVNDEIWLIPVPDSADYKVPVLYATERTLTSLDEVTDKLFEDLVVGYVYQRRGHDLIQSSGWRAGAYQVSSQTGQAFIATAEKHLTRVRQQLAMNYYGRRGDVRPTKLAEE